MTLSSSVVNTKWLPLHLFSSLPIVTFIIFFQAIIYPMYCMPTNRRLSTGRHIISWLCSLNLKQMPVSDNCSCICIWVVLAGNMHIANSPVPSVLATTHSPHRGRDRVVDGQSSRINNIIDIYLPCKDHKLLWHIEFIANSGSILVHTTERSTTTRPEVIYGR